MSVSFLSVWDIWKDFCKETKREKLWASIVKGYLQKKVDVILDVGCGTGEFISEFYNNASTIIGIDIEDYRETYKFHFHKVSFENYIGTKPDIIIFKQSFHLINKPFVVCEKYPNSTIIILQMTKPFWSKDNDWYTSPSSLNKNLENFNRLNYHTTVYRKSFEYQLSESIYRKMIIDGFTSDLRSMSKDERISIWNNVKDLNYLDEIDILIANPKNQTTFSKSSNVFL